jgi:hypothetical protein
VSIDVDADKLFDEEFEFEREESAARRGEGEYVRLLSVSSATASPKTRRALAFFFPVDGGGTA